MQSGVPGKLLGLNEKPQKTDLKSKAKGGCQQEPTSARPRNTARTAGRRLLQRADLELTPDHTPPPWTHARSEDGCANKTFTGMLQQRVCKRQKVPATMHPSTGDGEHHVPPHTGPSLGRGKEGSPDMHPHRARP